MSQDLKLLRRLFQSQNQWVSRSDLCAHMGFTDDQDGWHRISMLISAMNKKIRAGHYTIAGEPMIGWAISRNPINNARMVTNTEYAGLVFDNMQPDSRTRLETMLHGEQVALQSALKNSAVDLILEHQIKLGAVEACIHQFEQAELRSAQIRQAQQANAVPAPTEATASA